MTDTVWYQSEEGAQFQRYQGCKRVVRLRRKFHPLLRGIERTRICRRFRISTPTTQIRDIRDRNTYVETMSDRFHLRRFHLHQDFRFRFEPSGFCEYDR
jgi:hypothetical protein